MPERDQLLWGEETCVFCVGLGSGGNAGNPVSCAWWVGHLGSWEAQHASYLCTMSWMILLTHHKLCQTCS